MDKATFGVPQIDEAETVPPSMREGSDHMLDMHCQLDNINHIGSKESSGPASGVTTPYQFKSVEETRV